VNDIFCFFVNAKSVISLCLSVLFVMGEHTSSLGKFPTHHIMCMRGLITLPICSVQVVSHLSKLLIVYVTNTRWTQPKV